MKVKVKVHIDKRAMGLIHNEIQEALLETADAIKSDLVQSQTMPFGNDTTKEAKERGYVAGNLQNRSTYVKKELRKNRVKIVSDTPYARRLYYHPEYNFYQGHNSKAGGKWFDPYIDGKKKRYAQNVFSRKLKEKLK